MAWGFKKKDHKDYYDEAFLLAVFSPKENLEKLKAQYASMRKTTQNHHIMKAKMTGFMAGLEARNRSRLGLLDQASQQSKAQSKEDYER